MAESAPSYTVQPDLPTPEIYLSLRKASGLSAPPSGAVGKALANSKHCVLARLKPSAEHPEGEAIGMLRIVGDGSLFMELVDMCVIPQYQGKGIGKALMDKMLEWVDAECPDAYLSLIGSTQGQPLYLRSGFVPSTGLGMKRSKWGR